VRIKLINIDEGIEEVTEIKPVTSEPFVSYWKVNTVPPKLENVRIYKSDSFKKLG